MEKRIDFKHNRCKYVRILENHYNIHKNTVKKAILWFCFLMLEKNYFKVKVVFFHKNQLGIGVGWRTLAEMGQKLDFRAFYGEI